MRRIEEEYGGEIKDFVDQKQLLQENLDELQSTCNLTDIMLKDKGVELLLIKKEIEGKMTQLLEPPLPEMPSDPKYDVRFVPGDVALGRLSFGNEENKEHDILDDEILLKKMKMQESSASNGSLSVSQTNEPDVITNTAQNEKCKTKEMFTSMRSDMRAGFCNTNSQTEAKSLVSRDTCTNKVETRERGVFARVSDMKARGTMTERSDVRSLKCQTDQVDSKEMSSDLPNTDSGSKQLSLSALSKSGIVSSGPSTKQGYSGIIQFNEDVRSVELPGAESRRGANATGDFHQTDSRGNYRPAPDLLPTSVGFSNFSYTPSRGIRSIKTQTEKSAPEADLTANSADKEFVNSNVQKPTEAENLRQENETPAPLRRERPRRLRTVDTGVLPVHQVKRIQDMTDSATSPGNIHFRDAGVLVSCDISSKDTQTTSVKRDDSGTSTDRKSQLVRSTSTQAISMTDKDTTTPIVTSENKITWTEPTPTSDRATSTVATKTQERCTGTVPVKSGDISIQVKPYSSAVFTNTPVVSSSDQESQTIIETIDQGTIPDADIEARYSRKDKVDEIMDSSVDFITPPQSPGKSQVKTVDKATDPVKIPCFSKSTETVKVATMTSFTETTCVKFVDKDTSTSVTKTNDQWTATPQPQLISTGVTPPIPATLDVGVATNITLTDDQATCTDVKAFRDSHTETIVVVCDNETLTETIKQVDAQTSVDIHTDNQECETDNTENIDQSSMTERYSPRETVHTGTRSRQCEAPVLHNKETNTSRRRRKSKESQTLFSPNLCSFCGCTYASHGQDNTAPLSGSSASGTVFEDPLGPSLKAFKDSSTMPHPLDTQDVGTMAISCVTCQHEFHETAIQTSHPKLYDKSSATSFDLDLDFLERALSREYQVSMTPST